MSVVLTANCHKICRDNPKPWLWDSKHLAPETGLWSLQAAGAKNELRPLGKL